ncbi:hypothetical protein PB2503_05312 [Parvularcula bermudensis HTCC2503]|uniref:Uncharacterized protein n=1 Tax=Parvularcula bermudensis (strain ATCC BAA-594 / HTCC2503 / KCTC 12087) TaxID=314260 RepID=E0TG93_PARBH|nr:hypothetical protein [Parvularcula bermudensis]ADM09136.1 hypothetical protein PB2503_05312 [Parvularcula bermudensis HTCC2503]
MVLSLIATGLLALQADPGVGAVRAEMGTEGRVTVLRGTTSLPVEEALVLLPEDRVVVGPNSAARVEAYGCAVTMPANTITTVTTDLCDVAGAHSAKRSLRIGPGKYIASGLVAGAIIAGIDAVQDDDDGDDDDEAVSPD